MCRRYGTNRGHSRRKAVRRRDDGTDILAINLRNADDRSQVADLPVRMLDAAASWRLLEEQPSRAIFGW